MKRDDKKKRARFQKPSQQGFSTQGNFNKRSKSKLQSESFKPFATEQSRQSKIFSKFKQDQNFNPLEQLQIEYSQSSSDESSSSLSSDESSSSSIEEQKSGSFSSLNSSSQDTQEISRNGMEDNQPNRKSEDQQNKSGQEQVASPERSYIQEFYQTKLNLKLRQFQKATLQITKIHSVTFIQGTHQVFKTENPDGEKCPCCDKCLVKTNQEGQKFPITDVQSLKTLGISFPQYFRMVKYLILMLLFIFIGCFTCIILNATNQDKDVYEDCKNSNKENKEKCEDNSIMKQINPGHIQKPVLLTQQIIHFVQILALILVFELYYNKKMKNECVEMIVDMQKVADYTVMVKNLPDPYWVLSTRDHKGIKTYMENALNEQGQHWIKAYVDQVVACSDIQNLNILNQEIEKLQSLFYLLSQHKEEGEQTEFFQRRFLCFQKKLPPLYQVQTELSQKQRQREQLLNTLRYDHKKRVAFVSYRHIVDAKRILEQFQKPRFKTICSSKYDRYFEQHSIRVQQAPNPSDIFWSNLTFSKNQKKKKRIVVFFLIILILIITAGMVGWLSSQSTEYDQERDSNGGVNQINSQYLAVSLNISIAILFLNLGLEVVMDKITHIELHDTWTNHKISVAQKLTALMFLNTAAIPTWVFTQYTVDQFFQNSYIYWFSDNGLANQAYAILIINALCPPIFYFYLFNILYWANRLWAKAWEKWVLRQDEIYSQNRVNQESAIFEMDLAQRYAQSLKTFCAALFFAPLVPLGVLISAAGLFLEYWISKYMLLRVLSKPREYNQLLAMSMNNWIRFGILCYASGVLYFYFYLDFWKNRDVSGWIMMVLLGGLILGYSISTIFQLIPDSIHKQVRDCLEKKFNSSQRECVYYSVFRKRKDTDYWRENPVIAYDILNNMQRRSNSLRNLNYLEKFSLSPPSVYTGRI